MADKLSMQDIILTLQQFWAKQGCMLMQSYDTEKGCWYDESLHFLACNWS